MAKRQFAEAERILERIKLKAERTERSRGYLQALQGILLSNRSNNDHYAFLSNISLNDKSAIEKHRRDFLKQTRDSLHAEYDRGFFTAWADFTKILLRLENIPELQTNHTEICASPEEIVEDEFDSKKAKSVQLSLDKRSDSDY